MSVTTMRRAIAFIEGHPHADISVADIAQPLTGRESGDPIRSAVPPQHDRTGW
jgi:hypothetical protein